jgi:hypothetical protein
MRQGTKRFRAKVTANVPRDTLSNWKQRGSEVGARGQSRRGQSILDKISAKGLAVLRRGAACSCRILCRRTIAFRADIVRLEALRWRSGSGLET